MNPEILDGLKKRLDQDDFVNLIRSNKNINHNNLSLIIPSKDLMSLKKITGRTNLLYYINKFGVEKLFKYYNQYKLFDLFLKYNIRPNLDLINKRKIIFKAIQRRNYKIIAFIFSYGFVNIESNYNKIISIYGVSVKYQSLFYQQGQIINQEILTDPKITKYAIKNGNLDLIEAVVNLVPDSYLIIVTRSLEIVQHFINFDNFDPQLLSNQLFKNQDIRVYDYVRNLFLQKYQQSEQEKRLLLKSDIISALRMSNYKLIKFLVKAKNNEPEMIIDIYQLQLQSERKNKDILYHKSVLFLYKNNYIEISDLGLYLSLGFFNRQIDYLDGDQRHFYLLGLVEGFGTINNISVNIPINSYTLDPYYFGHNCSLQTITKLEQRPNFKISNWSDFLIGATNQANIELVKYVVETKIADYQKIGQNIGDLFDILISNTIKFDYYNLFVYLLDCTFQYQLTIEDPTQFGIMGFHIDYLYYLLRYNHYRYEYLYPKAKTDRMFDFILKYALEIAPPNADIIRILLGIYRFDSQNLYYYYLRYQNVTTEEILNLLEDYGDWEDPEAEDDQGFDF